MHCSTHEDGVGGHTQYGNVSGWFWGFFGLVWWCASPSTQPPTNQHHPSANGEHSLHGRKSVNGNWSSERMKANAKDGHFYAKCIELRVLFAFVLMALFFCWRVFPSLVWTCDAWQVLYRLRWNIRYEYANMWADSRNVKWNALFRWWVWNLHTIFL